MDHGSNCFAPIPYVAPRLIGVGDKNYTATRVADTLGVGFGNQGRLTVSPFATALPSFSIPLQEVPMLWPAITPR
jgi:hypothetical protein